MKSIRILITGILLIAASISSANAMFLCGDVNSSGKVDLLDASYIINALYRGGPPPASWDIADVDHSGKCNLLDISRIISWLYRDGAALDCPGDDPVGELIGHSSCKSGNMSLSADTLTNNHDCVAYEYDGAGVLTLKHINAGLNCCPIFASIITIEENNIIIEELDSLYESGCDCNCLFDLDYTISNLPPGLYHIRIIEPYIREEAELLEFDTDLSIATAGLYCVLRYDYPWGIPYISK
jgi:hypothetical protein